MELQDARHRWLTSQKPFTIRLHFDDVVFAYEYQVAKSKSWKLNSAACYSPKNLKKPFIQIGPQQHVAINAKALTEWIVTWSSSGSEPMRLQGEERMNLDIAMKFFDCITHFNGAYTSPKKSFQSGAVVNSEGGWIHTSRIATKSSRYTFN